ncbi:MAG: PAS domain S-box protein [Caldilineaceae bacterium]|nr:PAS domain S-box protein [Caldilineaceae bacterium]
MAVPAQVGQFIGQVTPFAECQGISDQIQKALEAGPESEFVCRADIDNMQLALELRFVGVGENQVLALVRNVTDRVRAEEQLLAAEERYRQVSGMISDYVFVADRQPDGAWRYDWSLQEVHRLTGYDDPGEYLETGGLPIHSEDGHIWVARQRLLGEGEEVVDELRIVNGAGATIWLKTFCRPVQDRTGKVNRVFGAIQDVTAIKQSEAQEKALLAEIQRQKLDLEGLTKRLAVVQEAERKVLAEDLHDLNGRNLTTLRFSLEKIQGILRHDLSDAKELTELVAFSLETLLDTLQRTRFMISELRPPLLDEFGLPRALDHYCTNLERRLDVRLLRRFSGTYSRLPLEVESVLFRVAQEALTNAIKHAQAETVFVEIQQADDCVRLLVRDDGIGFDTLLQHRADDDGHWGLVIMRERIASIHGRLHIRSVAGQGTSISVEVDR